MLLCNICLVIAVFFIQKCCTCFSFSQCLQGKGQWQWTGSWSSRSVSGRSNQKMKKFRDCSWKCQTEDRRSAVDWPEIWPISRRSIGTGQRCWVGAATARRQVPERPRLRRGPRRTAGVRRRPGRQGATEKPRNRGNRESRGSRISIKENTNKGESLLNPPSLLNLLFQTPRLHKPADFAIWMGSI